MAGLLRPVRGAVKEVLKHFWFSRNKLLNGKTLQVPIMMGQGWANLTEHEPDVERLVGRMLAATPGSFIDVGTNIGQTLLKVKAHDLQREYIGFEASIFCSFYVSQMIKSNGFPNSTVIPIGLSEKAQVIELFSAGSTDPQATTLPDFWTERNPKPFRDVILVDRGDAVVDSLDLDTVGVIKIDVEGAEMEVLRGFQATIARHKPYIMTEILPFTQQQAQLDARSQAILEKRRQRAAQLVALIKEMDYECFRLLPGGKLQATFEFDMPVYDDRMCNYVLLSKERLADIDKLGGRA